MCFISRIIIRFGLRTASYDSIRKSEKIFAFFSRGHNFRSSLINVCIRCAEFTSLEFLTKKTVKSYLHRPKHVVKMADIPNDAARRAVGFEENSRCDLPTSLSFLMTSIMAISTLESGMFSGAQKGEGRGNLSGGKRNSHKI